MSLQDIVRLTITALTRTPTRAGFGTLLLACAEVPWTTGAQVRVFEDTDAMVTAGFRRNAPAVQMAGIAFAQNPRLSRVKIGRRATAFEQVVRLTPAAPVAGQVYSLRVGTMAQVVGTNAFPLAVTPGGTLVFRVDGTDVTATFNAYAAVLTNNSGTATFAAPTSGDHLDLSINGTPLTPIVCTGFATRTAYLSAINTALGALGTAVAVSTAGFTLTTTRRGSSASVAVLGSTSAAVLTALGLTSGQTGTYAGDNNVANAAAVTADEYAEIIDAALPVGAIAVADTDEDDHPVLQARASIQIRPSSTLATVFGFDLLGHTAGTAVASYTADGTPTLAEVCTGLAAAINALPTLTQAVGSSTTHIDCTARIDNHLVSFDDFDAALEVEDRTADPGIADDLAALAAADNDWYGLALDSQGSAEILAAAEWAETHDKLFCEQTADTDCGDASIDSDVMSTLKALDRGRTASFYFPAIAAADGWIAAGILADRLPRDPGSYTWKFKTVAGVTARPVSATFLSAIVTGPEHAAKNGNVYVVENGTAIVTPGMVAAGEWCDIVRGLDWLKARIRERQFAALTANEKIPFTDGGIDLLRSGLNAQLVEGVRVGLLDTFTITTPRALDVPVENRAARSLRGPGLRFGGRVQGAIHDLDIDGTVTA